MKSELAWGCGRGGDGSPCQLSRVLSANLDHQKMCGATVNVQEMSAVGGEEDRKVLQLAPSLFPGVQRGDKKKFYSRV